MGGQRIRVAFFESRYYSLYGAQRSMLTLLEHLDRRVFDPFVVLTSEGALAHACREKGIPVTIVPIHACANAFGKAIPNYSVFKKALVGLAVAGFNVRALKLLLRERVDFVYCNDLRSLLYAGPAARVAKKPVSWYVRADGRLGVLHKVGVSLATHIITIADGVKSVFTRGELRRYGHRIRTIYTGFDLSPRRSASGARERIREQHGIPVDAKVIGVVSSISPRKSQHLLVDVMALLRERYSDVHFIFVGDVLEEYVSYKEEIDRRIDQLGLGAAVHWSGFVDNVEDYYDAFDLVVLPSRAEGLPRTVVEALGSGLPVVASDVGGVREVVTNPRLGRIVAYGDVQGTARAISSVIEQGEIRNESLSNYRRRTVVEKFTIEAYTRNFQRTVLEAVESNR